MAGTAFSLANKTALITGGTSGIGLATARRFVRHGAKVVISGRRPEGTAVAKEIGAHFIVADVSEPEDISRMVTDAARQLGGIDIIFSNAGAVVEFTMIEDTNDALLESMFNINGLAHYRIVRAALPHIRDGGSIIFNATLLTRLGNLGETAYGAAKSALVSMAKGFAMELAPRGIRVNAISPGATEGDMWPDDHPQLDAAKTLCPMDRLAGQDEVAALVQFLAADDCRFINGANIPIDGGMTAGFSPAMLGTLMDE